MSNVHALKVMYHTFGCKLNFAETATVAEQFGRRGHLGVANGDTPDIIVVNTCSVTAEADRKCRSAIRSWHRRWPEAAIIVTGCYAQLKAGEVSALPGVKAVAGSNDKLKIVDMAESAYLDMPTVADAKTLTEFMPSCSRGDRTRFFLKVQDGCDYWCSYCTIPRARGRSRSGTIEQLVAQARSAAEQGGKEIVLTGVNIGDFGHGRSDTLLDLCRRLDTVDGIERYRISSIEPNLLTDGLIDFCAASQRFMPHFHVPLQSGSDHVLRLMRRRYDTAFFAEKMQRIRSAMPHAFIGVDIIAGARGETPDQYALSRDFVASLDVAKLHVFPYSERPGTRALDLPDAVPQDVKHRRAEEMITLGAEKLAAFARKYLGTVRPVLLEHSSAGKPMGGFTDNYLRIRTHADPSLDNTVVPLRLDTIADDGETIIASMP